MSQKLAQARLNHLFYLAMGLGCLVVSLLIAILVYTQQQRQALHEAHERARLLLDRNLATHAYFASDLKPALFELTAPLTSDDAFEPSWMSSTYAVRKIDDYFQTLNPADYYYKEAAFNARNPANEADAFERAFLADLNADPTLTELTVIRWLDGQPYLQFIRRGEVLEESCLRCHSTPDRAPGELVSRYGPDRSFGRQAGEVVSAISIRVPLAEVYAENAQFRWQLIGLVVTLLAGLFALQTWFSRRLLWDPLARLQHQTRQILIDPRRLRDEIPLPAGRELRDLTIAFNRMATSLRQEQDRLEERVRERTITLERLNEQVRRDARIKTELLNEVNHRVRNNLMAIIGLLAIEEDYARDQNAQLEIALLARLERRIQGLAEAHRLLSASNWSPLPLSELAGQVVQVTANALATGQPQIEISPSPVRISSRQAAPLALLINELVTNTFKHAQPAEDEATSLCIHIECTNGPAGIHLTYRDNGPGYPAELLGMMDNPENNIEPGDRLARVGLYLLHNLVAGTLYGKLRLANSGGAVAIIEFPAEKISP